MQDDAGAAGGAELSLPAWPPYGEAEYPPLAYYKVRIIKADGEETLQVPSGAHIMVESNEGSITAVIAQPVTKHGDAQAAFFRPAGCVLPATAQMSWAGGFAAEVCKNVLQLSTVSSDATNNLLSKFNWARFTSEVHSRSNDTKSLAESNLAVVCDPWTLDPVRVAKSILYKDFTATSITPTVAADKRTVQDVPYLLSLDNTLEAEKPLLPRYVEAYTQQKDNGKVRLVSDRYALERNIAGANLFLCGDSIVSFSVSIKGTGSKAEATVKAKALPALSSAFLQYGVEE